MLEALARGNGKRFDALRIAGPAGDVHFRGRDRGRRTAVDIALQKANRALARRVVPERDVHMRINEARDRGRPVRIDDDVTAVYLGC